MNLTKPHKVVLALAGIWMAAFAVHAGCESSPGLDALSGVGAFRSDVLIDAQFARAPMFVAPNSLTQRTNYIDVSAEVPVDGETVHFELPMDSIAFEADAIDAGVNGDVEIELVVSSADSRSAPIRKSVATVRLQRDVTGNLQVVRAESPALGRDIVSLLSGGEVAVNVVVKSDLFGTTFVDGTKIRVGFGRLPGNGNDNTGNDNSTGNKNDNTGDDAGNDNAGGNTNDNAGDDSGNDNAGDDFGDDDSAGNMNDNAGDDSGNDNTAGNTNGNTGDDAGNDNAGDDSGNDNTDDNSNGNTGDDSGNDNTAGNTNDNTGDDTGNDNTAGNTNDNAGDDSGNDNTAGNSNDNTGDDNGNDNTGDNGNDNSSAGLCSDGSLQVRADVDGPGGIEVDARYSENGPDCKRFRLKIDGFATGWYDVFVNDVFVGEIFADSDDGEGEIRLETDNGNFPAGFPAVAAGDVVSVGDVIDVVLQTHCSEAFFCSNSNGNDNTGGNTNDNGAGNTNDNGAGNTNDNGA
ncbi:MAG: hypothetical protein H6818_19200 [Phycisphaerales bacterium]|nr:hypothetical protein [Phycisphaerales bacterium]